METQFQELSSKVDDIHRMLIGSEHEQENGILFRIKDNEKRVKQLEEWKSKIIYITIGMGLPASYGIIDLLKKLANVL